MSQAILYTARLTLEPLGDEHFDLEVELDSDPEVMRFLTGRGRTLEEIEAAHRRRRAVAESAPGFGFWAGRLADEYVGWWILEPPERAEQRIPGQAELGYRLLPRYWRRGLAAEGSRELIRHGFADLGLERIIAETMAVNAASRATMASVGLRYVRTVHLDFDDPLPGTEKGEVEYAITYDEWAAMTDSSRGE